MSLTFYVKQDDLLPVISATLYDGAGVVNLTGASVSFLMRNPATGAIKVNGSCSITSPATSGAVVYTWTGTDTSVPLIYEGEFRVTFASGKTENFPNDQFLRIVVTRKLV